MHAIVVISARDGSKTVPRKNREDWNGWPAIGWSTESVLDAIGIGAVDRFVVSTHDLEIARTAKRRGADTPSYGRIYWRQNKSR